MRCGWRFIFCYGYSIVTAQFVEKVILPSFSFLNFLPFFLEVLLHLCQKLVEHIYVCLFLGSWVYSTDLCVCPSTNTLITALTQSCPTLCSPLDCSPPGSSVHGMFQAKILELAAISYSRGSSWPRDLTCISVFCIGRWILYPCATWEAPVGYSYLYSKSLPV